MCWGNNSFNNQDIQLFGNLKEIIPYTIICFLLLIYVDFHLYQSNSFISLF